MRPGHASGLDVGSHIRQRGVVEDVLPMVREAAERVVLALPRKDVCPDIVGAPSLEIFDDRQHSNLKRNSTLRVDSLTIGYYSSSSERDLTMVHLALLLARPLLRPSAALQPAVRETKRSG
jgi:hypothetical protein